MNDNKAQAAYHPDQPPSPGGAGMTRTTADWEKLLDGTTPAPWEAHGTMVIAEGIPPYPPTVVSLSTVGNQGRDVELIAVAPEAVAEVIRLRRELEELRDDLGKAEYFSDPDPDDHALGEMQEASRIGRHITRILNPNGTR